MTQAHQTQAINERFDGSGISIPFPQREVHLYQVPAGAVTMGDKRA